VWKLHFDPQTNVIDVHLVRLRRKLDEGAATPCLETVWGRGYRLVATEPYR
jgi:DNA-binding response OmpR family regulator